jgi:hypothetical protein
LSHVLVSRQRATTTSTPAVITIASSTVISKSENPKLHGTGQTHAPNFTHDLND